MRERDKKRLKKQMEEQAAHLSIQEGEILVEAVLASCGALLKAAQDELSGQDVPVSGDVLAGYSAILWYVEDFCHKHGSSDTTAIEQQEKNIYELLKNAEALHERQKKAQQSLAEERKRKKQIQDQIDDLNRQMREEKAAAESLKKMRDAFPDQELNELKRENAQLQATIKEKEAELKNARDKSKKLAEEQEAVRKQIEDVQAQIDAIPEENHTLLEEFEKKKEVLEKLQKAQEECSLEKQAEMQKKIDELLPVVGELEVNASTLKERMQSLQRQYTSLDKDKQILTTNVIESIREAEDGLDHILAEHETVLRQTRETADSLAERLLACKKQRAELGGWFDAVRTPLETMIQVLDLPENTSLRQTLDVGGVPEVRSLLQQTEKNLKKLDEILEGCSGAAREDLQRIQQRAHK